MQKLTKCLNHNMQATKVKVTGPITKDTHHFEVHGILPNVDYAFVVEVMEKNTARKSGPTTFRTTVRHIKCITLEIIRTTELFA